jgi:hypothetical protein
VLPPGISAQAKTVFAGFLELLALRWLTTPGEAAPFTVGFAGPWCGLSVHEARVGFEELRRLGLVRPAGTDPRGLRLWLPAEGVMALA